MNCINQPNCRSNMQMRTSCGNSYKPKSRQEILESLPIAMGYVPWQHYNGTYDLAKGLKMGTIFPELCLPFCGVRGNCGCKTTK